MPIDSSNLYQQSSATAATATPDHRIELFDSTHAEDSLNQSKLGSLEDQVSNIPLSTESSGALSRKWTQGTLREELARRKYRRWQEGRAADELGAERNTLVSTAGGTNSQQGEGPAPKSSPNEGDREELGAHQASRLRRGRDRVRTIVSTRNRVHKTKYEDEAVDILYENQRGSFFFGIPLFSHKSLLNFDPPPWVNGYGRKSRVNVTNAQLPDPSWEWAWKSWYVDMSHDVDEEGWEYSFSFQRGFSWHGTHPWFHSFVRRRRWLRKRVRKPPVHPHAQDADAKTSQGPALQSNHPSPARSNSPTSMLGLSQAASSGAAALAPNDPTEELGEDVHDIETLMKQLKNAAVDREKVVAVRDFLDHGRDEVYHLAEKIPQIMSHFLFQTSRRQLLTMLMQKFEAASNHREEHLRRGEAEDEREKRDIDILLQAVKAADEEVKRLEYWSDIRDIARQGQTIGASGEAYGWGHEWQGIDNSGPHHSQSFTPDRGGSLHRGSHKADEFATDEQPPQSPTSTSEPRAGSDDNRATSAPDIHYNSEPEDQPIRLDKGKAREEGVM